MTALPATATREWRFVLEEAVFFTCAQMAEGRTAAAVVWELCRNYGASSWGLGQAFWCEAGSTAISSDLDHHHFHLKMDGVAAHSGDSYTDLLELWCNNAAARLEAEGVTIPTKLFERAFGPATWWRVLGLGPNDGPNEINAAWRFAMRTAHPDRGGSHAAATRLNQAREEGLRRQ